MSKKVGDEITVGKRVDPSFILLDEMCGRLEEVTDKLDKLVAFNRFYGPMTRIFKKDLQYQYATISAGGSGRIWYMVNPQPDALIGIIVQVGNSWFENTHLDWLIDGEPKKVEYVIGQIDNPKEYLRGIPFERDVEWVAYNSDDVAHTFEVLCDGFFVPKSLYQKIVG